MFDVDDRFNPYYQYTDTPRGTYWCTVRIEKAERGRVLGQRRRAVRRTSSGSAGARHRIAAVSRCPDESCCRRAPADLADSVGATSPGRAPARRRTLLAALPTGTFPGVDSTEVYEFLERHPPR